MKKQNPTKEIVSAKAAEPVAAKTVKKKGNGLLGRIIRRFLLVLFTVIILLFGDLLLVLNMVFNGPSPTARDQLTMTLIEASATKWVPALFIGEDTVAEIRVGVNAELEDDVTDKCLQYGRRFIHGYDVPGYLWALRRSRASSDHEQLFSAPV